MRDYGHELVSTLSIDMGSFDVVITCIRLKLLKDEIRQPYFLKLKRFLYDQGVKGPNDSASNLKVYPARERTVIRDTPRVLTLYPHQRRTYTRGPI